jgi:GNAT superfamily N-acetyltransferase
MGAAVSGTIERNKNIVIRRVDPADDHIEETIVELHKLCLPADTVYPPGDSFWWIGYDEDVPVCFAGLTASQQEVKGGYLCRAGVAPSHRGLGLQRRLIRVRERYARTLGWNVLVTDTYCNPQSANNLIACGYRLYSPVYTWSFTGACYWRKRI